MESARLRIRKFDEKDRAPFVKFMTDHESTKYLNFNTEQKCESGAIKLLETTIASYTTKNPMFAFAVENIATEEFVGFCGLSAQNKQDVEIMYAVMPDHRQKGYAKEIILSLADYALQKLKFSRVLAPISPENRYSRRAAEKSGFKDRGLIRHENYTEKVHDYVLESVVQKNSK